MQRVVGEGQNLGKNPQKSMYAAMFDFLPGLHA